MHDPGDQEPMVLWFCSFFFFNDTATTEIYPLSLHDALPIFLVTLLGFHRERRDRTRLQPFQRDRRRSEEHTSELQSPYDIVCRLLLAKHEQFHALGEAVPRARHVYSRGAFSARG